MSSVGVIMVLLTEEGFFRGWLWASLKRAGLNELQVLIWTSIAFSLWHISAVSLEKENQTNNSSIYILTIPPDRHRRLESLETYH